MMPWKYRIMLLASGFTILAGYYYVDDGKLEESVEAVLEEREEPSPPVLTEVQPISTEDKPQQLQPENTSLAKQVETADEQIQDEVLLLESERQSLVDAWDLENTPPEPSISNSEEWIDAPYAEEVQLENEESHCLENCADSLNEEFYAVNEFADQVNPDALRDQAIREGLIDPENLGYIPLSDKSDKAPPPLETGASIEPEETI